MQRVASSSRKVLRVALTLCLMGAGYLAVLVPGASATSPTAPPWEPDPDSAAPYGTLGFYDATGHVVTSGTNLTDLFRYVVASTPNPHTGTGQKATLYFDAPDHTQPTVNWGNSQYSAGASHAFPNASAPAPLAGPGFTYPMDSLNAGDANLSDALGSFVLDSGADSNGFSYANIIQVRMIATGSALQYWDADIAYNTGTSAITVDGVSVGAGDWVQLYPQPVATATTLGSSSNPSVVGQSVTYTATVTPTPVTGTVAFSDGGTVITGCSAVVVSNGQASCTTSVATLGSHSIVATYSGDPFNVRSQSSALTQTVNKASSTTSVAPSSNPAADNVGVTYTAAVSAVAPGTGTPTGSVTFSDNGSPATCGTAGVVALDGTGHASCAVAAYGSQGTHNITATYACDTNFSSSDNNSSPLVETIEGASTSTQVGSPGAVVTGQPVVYTATVTPTPDGGTVTFKDGSTTLCSAVAVSSGTASCTNSPNTAGSHQITALYTGTGNFAGSNSTVFAQTVNRASTTASTLSAGAVVTGQAVTYTATVLVVSPGSGTPSGSVTFKDGAATICSNVALSSGTSACTNTPSVAGTHQITAVYSGDTNFNSSTSTTYSQTVDKASTGTSVNPVTAVVTGQSATYTATVTVQAPGGGVPGGSVTFKDGTTSICSAAAVQSNGTATCAYTPLSSGSHQITADYSGDSNYSASTSAVTTQTVNADGTTTTVTSSANPSLVGTAVTYTATVTADAPGSGIPVGTVDFEDGSGTICAGVGLSAAGIATCTDTPATTGTHPITATFTATDGDYLASDSTANPFSESIVAATVPGAPSELSAKASDGQVTLTWVAPASDGGSALTGYDVYMSTKSGQEIAASEPTHSTTLVGSGLVEGTTSTVKGLTDGTTYYFEVRAVNAVGQSASSSEVSAMPVAAGYLMAGSDGGVFTFGGAPFRGSLGGMHLNAPVVGVARTPDHGGYWLAAADGGVFAFGDAHFYGSLGGVHLAAPIVAVIATPTGHGYWLVGSDGGVFAYGDAVFRGSLSSLHLAAPIVDGVASADGNGYLLVGSDGGAFSFGDAHFAGSLAGTRLSAPITGVAMAPGGGYWMVGADGGVFGSGTPQLGSSFSHLRLAAPVVSIVATQDGGGYWVITADGGVLAAGDAVYQGSLPAGGLAVRDVIGAA